MICFGNEFMLDNTKGFELGDLIQITEKFDGSNASIRYDNETGKLVSFSSKHELSFNNNLRGFWNYVQTLDISILSNTPNYILFGEWGARNAITYDKEYQNRWYLFDIFDTEKKQWLLQKDVKAFAKEHNLDYIHVLYEGEFISWEHCMAFLHSPYYGDIQEGCVIKNQTKINNANNRFPAYLKIVNDEFLEIVKPKSSKIPKTIDPEKEAARALAKEKAEMIVTRRRVEKQIYKLCDENIISIPLLPEDMEMVSKHLPKRVYEDCIKEANEIVKSAGSYFGKACSTLTMKYAREIILGRKET